jgi:hypothetical protein
VEQTSNSKPKKKKRSGKGFAVADQPIRPVKSGDCPVTDQAENESPQERVQVENREEPPVILEVPKRRSKICEMQAADFIELEPDPLPFVQPGVTIPGKIGNDRRPISIGLLPSQGDWSNVVGRECGRVDTTAEEEKPKTGFFSSLLSRFGGLRS